MDISLVQPKILCGYRTMEATRGNGYAPAWGSLVMMMMIVLYMLSCCVRSNMLGTQFTVYDNGQSPKGRNVNEDKVRREMVAIAYVSRCQLLLNQAVIVIVE